VDLRYAAPVGIIQWQTCFGYLWPPDIPCLFLLDDPANELFFLSVGLGAHRILTANWQC
jgi:hypothetical protein